MGLKLEILMICDLNDWILCNIATHIKKELSNKIELNILASHDINFLLNLSHKMKSVDVVHFLSPWDFKKYEKYLDCPVICTFWHVVDWTIFSQQVKRCDLITVGSEQWKTRIGEYTFNKIQICKLIYGLDTKKFYKKSEEKNKFLNKYELSDSTIVFGFAGKNSSNESNRKGIDRLFRCMLELKKNQNTKFILRITGKEWTTDIIPSELKDLVYIEPFLESSEMPRFYSSLDFYICTSSIEGVPYPVIESMACECVVMTTPVGIVPEIILNKKNGIILNEFDIVSDFVSYINFFEENLEQISVIGKNARDTIVKQFDWEKIIKPNYYETIYQKAIKMHSERSFLNKMAIKLRSSLYSYLYKYY